MKTYHPHPQIKTPSSPIQVPITIQSTFSKSKSKTKQSCGLDKAISFNDNNDSNCIIVNDDIDNSTLNKFPQTQTHQITSTSTYTRCNCQCQTKISIINDQICKLSSWIGLIFKLIEIVQVQKVDGCGENNGRKSNCGSLSGQKSKNTVNDTDKDQT